MPDRVAKENGKQLSLSFEKTRQLPPHNWLLWITLNPKGRLPGGVYTHGTCGKNCLRHFGGRK